MAVHDPYQQQAWFDRKVRPWLASAPATHKVLTWGNHDWCGQLCSFRDDSPAHARSTDLQILVDEGTTVPSGGGAGREMSVWATPWSNPFMRWAFMKEPRDLERGLRGDSRRHRRPGVAPTTVRSWRQHFRPRLTSCGARRQPRTARGDRESSTEGRDLWTCSRRLRLATSIRAFRSTTSASSTRATGSSTRRRSSTCRTSEAVWTVAVFRISRCSLILNVPVSSTSTADGIGVSRGYSGR